MLQSSCCDYEYQLIMGLEIVKKYQLYISQ